MRTPHADSPSRSARILTGLLLALVALLVLSLQAFRWPEYWWHLQIGEFIATWERIPDGQLFLFTRPVETTAYYPSWLGDLLLFWSHYFGGTEFSLLLRNLSGAIAVFVLSLGLVTPRIGPFAALPLCLLFAVGLSFLLAPTAMIFWLPLVALLTLLFVHTFESTQHRLLPWLIPLITLAIVPLDLFAATIASVVALGIGLYTRQVALLLTPLTLATFVYGPAALLPALSSAVDVSTAFVFLLILLLYLAIRTLPERYSAHALPGRKPLFALLGALVLLLGLTIPLQPGVPTRASVIEPLHNDLRTTPPMAQTLPDEMPLRCAEELLRSGPDLRLFADPRYRDFLLFHLYDPTAIRPLLFHDHRDLLPTELRLIPELLKTDPIARGIFAAHRINAVVVPRDAYPALLQDLANDPGWYDLDAELDRPHTCYLRVAP